LHYHTVKPRAVHRHYDVCIVAVGILQGVERPWSVYNIMPQWWHLMGLQYVAASFHLPSVSTAIINRVRYPKPHKKIWNANHLSSCYIQGAASSVKQQGSFCS